MSRSSWSINTWLVCATNENITDAAAPNSNRSTCPSHKPDRIEAFDFFPGLPKHHAVMIDLVFRVVVAFAPAFKSQHQLVLENLALQQQVTMLKRSVKRPRIAASDRWFWIVFSRYVED